ncbi:MAG: class I SAM-dependent methyltransferase [Gemmatimonadaceae bacterium]
MEDRRTAVPFDPEHFARREQAGEVLSPLERFRYIYHAHHWQGSVSPSGAGAAPDQTLGVQALLPELCRTLGIQTLLDLPCGDFSWMSRVPLDGVQYIGGDLVPELVEADQRTFGGNQRSFQVLDLTTSRLPPADLLLCRDCLVHLSVDDIRRAIRNVQRSGVRFLLTTTFPAQSENVDIATGDWRPLNLERSPFVFPPPQAIFNEGCTEGDGRFTDKSLALWRVSELPVAE